jgi:hypothetical protein
VTTPLGGVATAAAIIAGTADYTLSPALASVIAASVTAAGVVVVARLKASGRIGTTEASQLWAESQAMRAELHDQVVELRQEVGALRAEHESCLVNLNQMRAALVAAGINPTKETP